VTTVDARWSRACLTTKIADYHQLLSTREVVDEHCSTRDFADLILETSTPALLYLDPPYFVQGNALYQQGFTLDDHMRLAACLRQTSHAWLLSYDDCQDIRDLYSWAQIEAIPVWNGNRRCQGHELLIAPHDQGR
jgi:DNA adenine methylase